jgi:hypothetical protein
LSIPVCDVTSDQPQGLDDVNFHVTISSLSIGLMIFAACTSKSLPIPEEAADRKQALDIKINLLVIQVQRGQLTMDAYLRQVESRLARDTQLALLFKKAGNLELAARAMKQRKIMQEEVDEVKQTQAQEADA